MSSLKWFVLSLASLASSLPQPLPYGYPKLPVPAPGSPYRARAASAPANFTPPHVLETAPGYSGYGLVWQDGFGGAAGSPPNGANWNIVTGTNVNNEVQVYTGSSANLQLSGGQTLQIVPRRDSSVSGGWTSARVESVYTFTPAAGRRTMGEARIRFGGASAANAQGVWPAFWLLGDSIRHGTPWPASGEIDVMERVNGLPTGYGTIHCDVYPGGVCNEPTGLGQSVAIPDEGWHNWRVTWDRTSGDWAAQSLTWQLDGNTYHTVTGGQVGQTVWNSLAASPLYFILNVAIGGDWVSERGKPLMIPNFPREMTC